jgi:hypothetical protein
VGKVVTWSGTVQSVAEALGSGFTIGVSMVPTESALGSSDITLVASDSLKDAVIALNKGDKVRFTGRFVSQGGFILNHQIDLMRLAK